MRSRIKLLIGSALLLGIFSQPSLLWGQVTPDNPPAGSAKDQKVEPGAPDAKMIMNKLHGLSVDQRIIIDRLDQALEILKESRGVKNATAVTGQEPRKLPEETVALKADVNGQQDQMSAIAK